MNLEKMRKSNARKTPDTISAVFDALDDDVYNKQNEWMQRFRKHMSIKHGDKIDSIACFLDDTEYSNLKKVTLKVSVE